MKVFPERIFEKTSNLSPDEVVRKLAQMTEPSWNKLRYLYSGKLFAGQVMKNGFKLIRIDPRRSKSRPLFFGKVRANGSGSRIIIKLGHNQKLSLLFSSVFTLFFLQLLISFFQNKLIALVATALIALSILGWFWMDFDREYREIKKIFDKNF